jgi:hypothetical protein
MRQYVDKMVERDTPGPISQAVEREKKNNLINRETPRPLDVQSITRQVGKQTSSSSPASLLLSSLPQSLLGASVDLRLTILLTTLHLIAITLVPHL